MTNEQAARRALKAMHRAYSEEEDAGGLASGELLLMLMDAVRAEFLSPKEKQRIREKESAK